MFDFGSGFKLGDCSLYTAGQGNSVLSLDTPENAYMLLCIKNGSVKMSCRDELVTLGINDFVLVFPGENVSFVKCGDDFLYDVVVFSVDSRRYNDFFFEINREKTAVSARVFSNECLENTVRCICKELETLHLSYSNDMLSLLCNQMILYLARVFEIDIYGKKDTNEINEKVCAQVMKLIDSRIFTMKNLREVASAMGYNYSYISSLFHKTTGVTLNNYFKNKRMSEARKLLSDNKMSISEIARIMNYSSVYAFSKAFKEHFGASPGHYSGRFPNKE